MLGGQAKGLYFSKFMFLLYSVMCNLPGCKIKGKYLESNQGFSGTGQQSTFWQELVEAFSILEEDFKRFDANGDQLLEYTEITEAIPVTKVAPHA